MKKAMGLFLAFSAAAVFAGGADLAGFPFVKELVPPGQTESVLSAVALDEDVFAETGDLFANLRLFDRDGRETPFLRAVATQTRTVERTVEVPVRILDFKLLPENRCEIVIERTDEMRGPAVGELFLQTPLRNFEKEVQVFSSDDRAGWDEVARETAVFDYSRYLDVRNETVQVALSMKRYYRVLIANLSEERRAPMRQLVRETQGGQATRETETVTLNTEDFRVSRIAARGVVRDESVKGPVLRTYSVSGLSVTHDSKEGTSSIEFSLRRVPLTSLKLLAEGAQFSRQAYLYGTADSGAKAVWRRLSSARIERIRLARTRVESMDIVLPRAARFSRYRVVIENRDSPTLEVKGVEATGEAQELLFFAAQGAGYMLAYGGPLDRLPQYDIAGVLGQPPYSPSQRYGAGPQRDNPGWKPARFDVGAGRPLFIAGLVVMVLVLVWAIARAARQMDTSGTAS